MRQLQPALFMSASAAIGDSLLQRAFGGQARRSPPRLTIQVCRPDLVLANLDRQTLMMLCDELARYASHGARLLLSGILLDQEQEIVEAFSKVGAMLSQRREQEGWVGLELLMVKSCEGVGV